MNEPSKSTPPVELSVIAPCYNEEGNVFELTRRMLAMFDTLPVPAELLLIDDGSKDRTWERIQDAMASDPRVRGEQHPKNRGIEGGWLTGLAIAHGRLVALIDSDLQNPPEDIARLHEAYREGGCDIVQGVRHPVNVHSRLFFSRALSHILNVTFAMRLRDNKSGFLLCSKEVLADLLDHRYHYRYFQNFIGAAIGVKGYKVREVDTEFRPRHAGQSFLSDFPVWVSLKIGAELVKYRVESLPAQIKRF